MSYQASPFAQGVLVQMMHAYSAYVFSPYRIAKELGLVTPNISGQPPKPNPRKGLGKYFSQHYKRPLMMTQASQHDHLVEEFDRMGEIYDAYVRPFSTPLMDEAVHALEPYIDRRFRIMDAGCGCGREVCRMSRLVPEGEVVGIDLAAGMVNAAQRAAHAKGFDNTAFVQSDVGQLPTEFNGKFDMVYSSLAHHHYPNPGAATQAIFNCLRPGGIYAVIDAGPEWFVKSSSPIAAWSDPGWIGFHTPKQFTDLFSNAGFEQCGWIGLVPGFGIAIAQKPDS